MKIEFTIPGGLPSLNEIIGAGKNHWGSYSSMKEANTGMIVLKTKKVPQIEKPFQITCRWISENRKKDPDNISVGIKFILDGLYQGAIIPQDTQRYVKRIVHEFGIDPRNPRIEVEIEEVEEEKP